MKLGTFVLLCGVVGVLAAEPAKPVYQNDFQKAAVDSVPEDFLVLDGAFGVKEDGGNKFLELPGAPLETYGAMFGPAEKDNVAATARFFGTGKGRRYPSFGVGVAGVGGYKLRVSPAKKAIELYKGDVLKTTLPYDWESGKWTHVFIQLRKVQEGEWKVEGKVWQEGQTEPKDWMIAVDDKEQPSAGKASIWGSPYSGTPIRFDDLAVISLKPVS